MICSVNRASEEWIAIMIPSPASHSRLKTIEQKESKIMPPELNNSNVGLLRVIQHIFRLPNNAIAEAGGVSATYLSKLLKGKIIGSSSFYATLNKNIGQVIMNAGDVFQLSGNSIDNADKVIEQLDPAV